MRVVKYPDFNKERSKAVLFDGKRRYTVNVEIGDYKYSHVDYENGVIHLRRDSPDIVLEFFHEIHHLYKPLLEPIWTPTLPTLKDECIVAKVYADENARDEVFKTIEKMLKPKSDKRSKITVEIIKAFFKPLISLGRFDNISEDVKIHHHLRKCHKIPEERLKIVERDVKLVHDAITRSIQALYSDKFKLLKDYSTLVNSFVKRYKTCYGLIFYTIIDFSICLYSNWSLERYYDTCIRTLQDAEKYVSKLRGIFKHVTQHRIRLERSRVKIMQKAIKIPYVVYNLAHVLLSLDIHSTDVERLLNFKFVNGYRDPLAILKNGVIETWYRCYMVKKII